MPSRPVLSKIGSSFLRIFGAVQLEPSGNLWQFAIENGPFIVDLPIKHGDFP